MLYAFRWSVSGRDGGSTTGSGHHELLYSPELSIGPHVGHIRTIIIALNSHSIIKRRDGGVEKSVAPTTERSGPAMRSARSLWGDLPRSAWLTDPDVFLREMIEGVYLEWKPDH